MSQIVPKGSLFYFNAIMAASFVTIAMVKVELMPDLYTKDIILIN